MHASVAVFGGTFDPVHNGHVAIAAQVRDGAGVDVWFVPANRPPLHAPAQATAQQRMRLLRAALDDTPGFAALDVELRRGGVSYTADTMRELHALHPARELLLLLGADAARSITRWDRGDELLAVERFLIVNRSGVDALHDAELRALGYDDTRTRRVEVDSPPVSASDVRRRVAAGEDVAALVPPSVAALIAELGLYRSGAPVHNAGG